MTTPAAIVSSTTSTSCTGALDATHDASLIGRRRASVNLSVEFEGDRFLREEGRDHRPAGATHLLLGAMDGFVGRQQRFRIGKRQFSAKLPA